MPNKRCTDTEVKLQKGTSLESSGDVVWVDLCAFSELNEGEVHGYELELSSEPPLTLAVVRLSETVYALYDECPHRRVKFSQGGFIDGDMIICGWHQWGFNLETGAHMIPTGNCVKTYQTRVIDGRVEVALQSV